MIDSIKRFGLLVLTLKRLKDIVRAVLEPLKTRVVTLGQGRHATRAPGKEHYDMLVRGIMAIIVLFSTAIVSVTFLIDQPDQTALESADHGYGTTPLAKAPASLPVLLPKSLHTAPIG